MHSELYDFRRVVDTAGTAVPLFDPGREHAHHAPVFARRLWITTLRTNTGWIAIGGPHLANPAESTQTGLIIAPGERCPIWPWESVWLCALWLNAETAGDGIAGLFEAGSDQADVQADGTAIQGQY